MTDFNAVCGILDSTVSNVDGGSYGDHSCEWFWRVESSYSWLAGNNCYVDIRFERYALLRHTKQGVWVVPYCIKDYPTKVKEAKKKLVLHNTRKRYAYPTKALAWVSFVIRQERRRQYARNNLEAVEAIYSVVKEKEKNWT